MTVKESRSILPFLPEVRGRYSENSLLSKVTWFQVGGPAQILFKPADHEDLIHFLKNKPTLLPMTTIGVGSNLLVRDGGVEGIVLRLGKGFTDISVSENKITVGAGVLDINTSFFASQHSLGGFEFLSGIPGTIGGAIRMNAGAYGHEIKDIFISALALDPTGNLHKLSLSDMGFATRHSSIPDDWIFIQAELQGYPEKADIILEKNNFIKQQRESTQPVRSRTGGSTFVNPQGKKAWELIDQAGCRGLRYGNAMVSELHCNFLINEGEATAHDIESLGQQVQARVLNKTGILLDWEIKRIGY